MARRSDWRETNRFVAHMDDDKPKEHHDFGAIFGEIGDGFKKLTHTVMDHSHEILENHGLIKNEPGPDAQIYRMDRYRSLPKDLED